MSAGSRKPIVSLIVPLRAMLLSEQTLIVAGPPDLIDEEEAARNKGEESMERLLADQLSALSGAEAHANFLKPRTKRELTQVLRNQLVALEAYGAPGELGDLKLAVQNEISALEDGTHASPWQEGMPPAIEASLQPYQDRLDELFCEAAVEFELRQKNKNPVGFRD